MAITNGTFDTNLNGWNNNNASAYEVEVVWDNGRSRLTKRGSDRITGCGAPWMNQTFLIDRDFLSFDWTSYKSWTTSENQFSWSLVVHTTGGDTTLVSEAIQSTYTAGYMSGHKNIDVSAYKGLNATISFWYFYGGCTFSWAIASIWIDNVTLYSLACPTTVKNVGNTLTLQATPIQGVAPYTVEFRRANSQNMVNIIDTTNINGETYLIPTGRLGGSSNPVLGVVEGFTTTRLYTIDVVDINDATSKVPGEGASLLFASKMIDSCTPSQSCVKYCKIFVACAVPVCDFTVT